MINKNINSSVYFPSVIYTIEIPEWVDEIDKICDEYIEDSIKNSKEILNNRIKKLNKNIEDHGYSYHSKNYIPNPRRVGHIILYNTPIDPIQNLAAPQVSRFYIRNVFCSIGLSLYPVYFTIRNHRIRLLDFHPFLPISPCSS